MRKTLLALSGLILPLVAGAAVTVEWIAPESYRDAYATSSKSDKSRQTALDDFKSFIISTASPLVKEGDNLKISVTQLDMTGEFEQWDPRMADVRKFKSPYSGRIAFHYALTDAGGKIIKEGDARLTNDMLVMYDQRDKDAMDPYLHSSLRDWMHSNLGKATKK